MERSRFHCCSSLVVALGLLIVSAGCSPPSIENAMLGDVRPPMIKNAELDEESEFHLEFDEPVRVASEGFSIQPKTRSANFEGENAVVLIRFSPNPLPGELVTLSGNVEDFAGNRTHVQIQFKGYNSRPAGLVISEVQTGKNSSKRAPHRDYIELYVAREGNLAGAFLRWANSTKVMKYEFPACEVKKSEVIVVHCAPEGIPDEKDEIGNNTAVSGGIDATPQGRDLWSTAGGLPDATGAIALYAREGESATDGLFYAESDKSGPIETSKLSALAQELGDAHIWAIDAPLTWDKAFHWKSSTSKPFVRTSFEETGALAWGIGESSSQSPGVVP